MGVVSLIVGTKFEYAETKYELAWREEETGVYVAQDPRGLTRTFTADEIGKLHGQGLLRFCGADERIENYKVVATRRLLNELAGGNGKNDARDYAVRVARVLAAIEKAGITEIGSRSAKPIIDSIMLNEGFYRIRVEMGTERKVPFTPSCLRRWSQRSIFAEGDIGRLAKQKRGPRRGWIHPRFCDLADKAIESKWNKPNCFCKRVVWVEFKALCEEEKKSPRSQTAVPLPAKIPSPGWLRKRIHEWDQSRQCVTRHGREFGRRIYRFHVGGPERSDILESGIGDCVLLPILVREDQEKLKRFQRHEAVILGRPWMSVIIDGFSWMVLGFYIGFEHPSNLTLQWTLRHAAARKDYIRDHPDLYKCRNDWPAWGLCRDVIFDQALESHSNLLEYAILRTGMTVQLNVRKSPWQKSLIENFNNALEKFVRRLHGALREGPDGKLHPTAPAHTLLTPEQLTVFITRWKVDWWNQRPRPQLGGLSPSRVWKEAEKTHFFRLRHEISELRHIFAEHKYDARLTNDGIRFGNLTYNDCDHDDPWALRHILRRHGTYSNGGASCKVHIEFDRSNRGFIDVIDPESAKPIHVLVDPRWREFATGLSQHRLDRIRKNVIHKPGETPDLEDYERAERQIYQDDEALRVSNSKTTHKHHARTEGIGSQSQTEDGTLVSTKAKPPKRQQPKVERLPPRPPSTGAKIPVFESENALDYPGRDDGGDR